MSIDAATVRKVARLARIREPEEKLEQLAAELSGILQWIEQLNEVDTTHEHTGQKAGQITDDTAADRKKAALPGRAAAHKFIGYALERNKTFARFARGDAQKFYPG